MKILIRADASLDMGSGHIMRCLTLARALRQKGHELHFICRAHQGHLGEVISQADFALTLLPQTHSATLSGSLKHAAWLGCSQEQDFADCLPTLLAFSPDWVICDHYALSDIWEKRVKEHSSCKLLVIDDLADRAHLADILLDQNHGHTAQDYQTKLPEHTLVLAGTHYALLREEFQQQRNTSLAHQDQRSGSIKNILLNLGGVDKDNHTLTLLNALNQCSGSLKKDWQLTIILGKTSPHIASIQAACQHLSFPCQVLININNIAQWMAKSDLAIGAAGSTSWERCCLGLPSILVVLADNQQTIAKHLQQIGAASYLHHHELNAEKLETLFRQPESVWQAQSQKARALCDGQGVWRVCHRLKHFTHESKHLRSVQADDAQRLFQWRNHPDIRCWMLQQQPLEWSSHVAWLTRQLDNPDFIMLIYQIDGVPQGFVSFKRLPEQKNTWEWGFYLAPDCPRGHGTPMGKRAISWAFTHLNAEKIIGSVLTNNSKSLRLHKKLGFIADTQPTTLNNTTLQTFYLTENQFETFAKALDLSEIGSW